MPRVFADLTPLRVSPAYRRLWLGHAVANFGQQMTVVAVGIQVYAMTNSSLAVGMVGLFQLVPLIVLGLYGGALSDLHDRRTVTLLSSIGMWVCVAGLLLQSVAGWDSLPILYGLIAAQSGFYAVSNPARASIIPRLIEPRLLPAANALGMITWNLGFTLGPLFGGLLIAGTGSVSAAYLMDVLGYTAAVWAMWRLPKLPPEPRAEGAARPKAGWATVVEGLRFLRGKRNLQMNFGIDIAAMVFGMPRALFPAIAAAWYGGDARQVAAVVGLLSAAPAVGALISAVLSGPLGRVRRQGLAVVISVLVWGAAIAAFGAVRWLPLALLLLAIAGAADNVSAIFRNTILQAATPDEFRGRLQGVHTVVVAGGPRAGDVEAGAVAAAFGETVSVISGGLLCIAAAIALAASFPSFLRYDARDPQP